MERGPEAGTVDLAGSQPEPIRRVQVSAALGPVFDPDARPNPTDLTQNRFTALRGFDIWACDATRSNCSTDAGFTRVFASGDDAFPGDAPRPVQPALILREFEIPRTRATHLRLVVRTSQCTGGPDFQGEQDLDPSTPRTATRTPAPHRPGSCAPRSCRRSSAERA